MTIYKIHVSCDNIRSNTCYFIYNLESVYLADGYPAEAKTFQEMDVDTREEKVKRFDVQNDGLLVKVLLA